MTVVERLVAVPAAVDRPRRIADWPSILNDLAHQLDQDHVYARDLPDLAHALDQVIRAFRRQTNRRLAPS